MIVMVCRVVVFVTCVPLSVCVHFGAKWDNGFVTTVLQRRRSEFANHDRRISRLSPTEYCTRPSAPSFLCAIRSRQLICLRQNAPMRQIASQAVILAVKSDTSMRIMDAAAARHRPVDAVNEEQPWTSPRPRAAPALAITRMTATGSEPPIAAVRTNGSSCFGSLSTCISRQMLSSYTGHR